MRWYTVYEIVNSANRKPSIIAITCDNGPDFSPTSYLVFIAWGRLWKNLNLDQLFITSYAPYTSKYNSIELAWGKLSQELAQVILCPEAKSCNFKNKEEVKQLFEKAMGELETIWKQTQYGSKDVICKNKSPTDNENPFSDYETVKEVLAKGKKSSFFDEYKEEIKFLMSHVHRRNYFLHFRKCFSMNCEHCKNNIKHPEAFEVLKKYSGNECTLLKPVLIQDSRSL